MIVISKSYSPLFPLMNGGFRLQTLKEKGGYSGP